MAFTTETLPSEYIFTVTSGSESVFPLPTLQDPSNSFGGSDVALGVEKNGSTLTLNVGYTLGPTGYLTTTTALVPGETLRVYRQTNRTAPLVTATLQAFTSSMFNKGFWQMIFLIQELLSSIQKALVYVVDATGALVWDFENKRGVSCASPVGSLDVANKTYVDSTVASQVATEAGLRAAGDAALYAYIASTVAALSTSANLHVTSTTGTVLAGATHIDLIVPFGSFTGGQLNINGVVYDVATECTLSDNSGNTRVTLPSPVTVDGNFIILMF